MKVLFGVCQLVRPLRNTRRPSSLRVNPTSFADYLAYRTPGHRPVLQFSGQSFECGQIALQDLFRFCFGFLYNHMPLSPKPIFIG